MYYEEFTPGQVLQTGTRAVTETDLDQFLALAWLDNPIFLDDEGARAAGHAGRIVPAPFQLSVAMGLAQRSGLFDHVVAVLEFDRLRFHRTVFPGEALTLNATVVSVRPTTKPGRGVVVLDYRMTGPQDQTIMTGMATYLMRRAPVH